MSQVSELSGILKQISEDSVLKRKLRAKRAEYNPKKNLVELYFETVKHCPPHDFLPLREELGSFRGEGLFIALDQQAFAQEAQQDCAKIATDYIRLLHPAMRIFLNNARVEAEEGTLHVDFDGEMGKDLFLSMGLREKLKEYFLETYGMRFTVQAGVDETLHKETKKEEKETAKQEVTPEQEDRDAPKLEEKKQEPAPKAPPREKISAPRAEKKPERRGRVSTVTPMKDLQAGAKYSIEGEVIHVEEDFPLKGGEYIKKKFIVSDYTTSVLCYYIKGSRYPLKFDDVSAGQHVVVTGMYDADQYERDQLTMKVTNIQPSGYRPRMDTVDEKRVELHAHTQMSAQDGLCDVKELISRAAKWGHKAIAITDHGVVQAFPDAAGAAGKAGIKVIYGVEAYMVDDRKKIFDAEEAAPFDGEFIVFDIETTGLAPVSCDITEIGAVRVKDRRIVDRFQTFVKPGKPIPARIVALTGITDDMVKDAPLPGEALTAFKEFCGDSAVLVAHNAGFDTKFIFSKSTPLGIKYTNKVLDTVPLCRVVYPKLKNHKLDTIAAHLRLPLNHHRAADDAACTAEILLRCFGELEKQDVYDLQGINAMAMGKGARKNTKSSHIVLLCKNQKGLVNLYKLVSFAHIDHFYRRPRTPKSLIAAHREGLLVGSACGGGELYMAAIEGADDEKLEEIASFYDYIEIQPRGNNEYMVREGLISDISEVLECNKKLYELGKRLGKPVVATGDVHFIEPHGEYFRRVISRVQNIDDAQPPLYFRTTQDMLAEFAYLGKDAAYEVVVENTNKIAGMTEEITLFDKETAMPVIEGAAEKITEMAFKTAKEVYGDPLPEIVQARLERELDAIVTHGFSVLYYSAHLLVKKSNDDGYLVGSRGSVGSSLAATMTGITEVNPLPPHYICPNCKHSDFEVDKDQYTCGADLPDAVCPQCGTQYQKNGFDIPFEVFLGINADKVPDIDLNFSGEYQANAHRYTEELFGADHVFRAGTILTVKDKIAYGYVKKYMEETGTQANDWEVGRLIQGISGTKKSTGQHPGGMVIVPSDREIYEFTPVQKPADDMGSDSITTHFDFNSMHDILVKLDILGHDVPTIIRMLQDLTGMDPLDIPLDDQETMKLFSGLEPLGLKPEKLFGIEMGTLGIPEFGTGFVRQMLKETMPTTMGDIVNICGLSHGTDVWLGNAQELIKNGICRLSETICARDDIMNHLVARGVDKRMAFFIMEKVRKGQVAKKGFTEEEEQALKDANIKEWFIESCRKIKYMFPKAHAVAYVIMSFRIAYCKVHYKEAFYASYFSVRSREFDASMVADGMNDIKKSYRVLESKGNKATANEKNMANMLEVACEMYLRDVHFLPIDLYKSDAVKFLVEDGNLRLPFVSVPGLGENAAQGIARERELPFLSVEDLKKRAKISASVVEELGKMGALAGLTQTNQMSLFD